MDIVRGKRLERSDHWCGRRARGAGPASAIESFDSSRSMLALELGKVPNLEFLEADASGSSWRKRRAGDRAVPA